MPDLSLFVAFVGEVLAQGFTPRCPEGRWGHTRARSGRSHRAPTRFFGGWAAALPVGGEFRASVSGKFWAIRQWASPLFVLGRLPPALHARGEQRDGLRDDGGDDRVLKTSKTGMSNSVGRRAELEDSKPL